MLCAECFVWLGPHKTRPGGKYQTDAMRTSQGSYASQALRLRVRGR